MPGPYPRDGHYMYGNCHIQPYPAYYNSSWYHRKPPRRDLYSLMEFYDDGSYYIPDNKPGDPSAPIPRGLTASSILNIETLAMRSLRIKLYAMKEEDDTDILLELGKGYSITYITEGGLKVATGVLKIIDTTIPDTCTRYIGEFNETVATAWIGMDCSVVGKSDKRKIFVASIRAIEEADITDPDYVAPDVDISDMSDTEKLNKMLEYINGFIPKLDQILLKVADNDEIIPKLEEMGPTEKLDLILSKIDAHDSKVDAKFAEILVKLGSMPYDDKIDYIYSKVSSTDTTVNSTKEKVDAIKTALENGGVDFSFLGG